MLTVVDFSADADTMDDKDAGDRTGAFELRVRGKWYVMSISTWQLRKGVRKRSQVKLGVRGHADAVFPDGFIISNQ